MNRIGHWTISILDQNNEVLHVFSFQVLLINVMVVFLSKTYTDWTLLMFAHSSKIITNICYAILVPLACTSKSLLTFNPFATAIRPL